MCYLKRDPKNSNINLQCGLIDLMKKNKVIDLHAHIVIPESMGKAGSYGPEMGVESNGVGFFPFGGYSMKRLR
tara:strand:+ start:60 stop:278 length:219 start_codon:yes stop_codon:yes gene_type:complete